MWSCYPHTVQDVWLENLWCDSPSRWNSSKSTFACPSPPLDLQHSHFFPVFFHSCNLLERYYLYMVRVISVVLTPPSPKRDDFVSFYITVATSFLPRFPSWQRALWQPQLFRKSISRNVISHNIWNCRQILQMHARDHAESINSEGSVRKWFILRAPMYYIYLYEKFIHLVPLKNVNLVSSKVLRFPMRNI